MTGERCAVLAGSLGEPLAGTAPVATSWLCVEQNGPWGRDALVDSHFGAEVAAVLGARARGTGVRIAVIRRPGPHADRHRPAPRTVLLAHTAPGSTWLERGVLGEPKELLDLDLAALGRGEPAGFGEPVSDPVLLVCTNGRRDLCCALTGRPVAAELATRYGPAVWECSHLGGHRFAPTAVLLPNGYAYGRIDADTGGRLLESAVVRPDLCRGRSTWDKAGQVAELAVRELIDDTDPEALSVTGSLVSHVDGRAWRVRMVERTGPARPPSCGAEPVPAMSYVATEIVAV